MSAFSSCYLVFYFDCQGLLYTVNDGVCTQSPIKGNVSLPCFSWEGKNIVCKDFIIQMENRNLIEYFVNILSSFALW